MVSGSPRIFDSLINGEDFSVIVAVRQGSTSFRSKVIKLVLEPTEAVIFILYTPGTYVIISLELKVYLPVAVLKVAVVEPVIEQMFWVPLIIEHE